MVNEQLWTGGPPARILLATDLSARCDRAFDRAVQLAREWRSEIVVLTVIEGVTTPDEAYAWLSEGDSGRERFVRRQLRQEVADLDVPVTVQIGHGDVADAIRDVATAQGCGLIVTGMARNEAFGRFWIGSTVERLAQALPQPLLVVRRRVRGPYRRILVATDFSEPSRYAFQTAQRFYPDRKFILYHAFGRMDDPDDAVVSRTIEQGECATFLSASGLSGVEGDSVQVVIERGSVEIALPRFLKRPGSGVDLAVVGTHGRSRLMNVLIGSSALRLLEWLPCDTMLVRQPRSSA